MSKPTFQIDLKPVAENESFTSYFLILMVNGCSFKCIVSQDEVERMKHYGLVKQVTYQIEVDGKLETREYENKLDGAGVQYTSKCYELVELK